MSLIDELSGALGVDIQRAIRGLTERKRQHGDVSPGGIWCPTGRGTYYRIVSSDVNSVVISDGDVEHKVSWKIVGPHVSFFCDCPAGWFAHLANKPFCRHTVALSEELLGTGVISNVRGILLVGEQ